MNIAMGLWVAGISVIIIVSSVKINKKKKKWIRVGFLMLGVLLLCISGCLLTGLYDPYSSHL